MRWDIIKKAWSLAAEKYPDVKRLYVALPDQFLGFGECPIIDLDKPEDPVGKIRYEAKCEDGQPVMSLSIEDMIKTSSMARTPSCNMKTAAVFATLEPKTSIGAKDILAKYPDPKILGEQIAYLIAGHEDGLVKLGKIVYHAQTKGGFAGGLSTDIGSDADILGKGFYFGSKEYVEANYGTPEAFEVTGNFASQQQWMDLLKKYQHSNIQEQRSAAREELKAAGYVGIDTGHIGVVWDASSIKPAGPQIHEGVIASWMDDHGFPSDVIPHVEAKLSQLGIKIAKRKRPKRFQNYEKVRVVDPLIMEHNEGAQVMVRKRDKDGHDWYHVLVDGSEKPIWLREEQLAKNEVGSIRDISATDQGKA